MSTQCQPVGWRAAVTSADSPPSQAELPWVRIGSGRKVCVYGLCMGYGVHIGLINNYIENEEIGGKSVKILL